MKFTSLTKRMVILTAMIALLLIGAGVHTCGKTNIPEAKASKGSGSTYSSGIIANEKCIVAGFNKRRKKGFAYCCDHKCCIHDCPSQRLSTDIYCQSHHDAYKKNRNGYNGGLQPETAAKKEEPGPSQRRAVLSEFLDKKDLYGMYDKAKELGCKQDDLIDANCLAVTGALYAHGEYETIPAEPESDEKGLLMQLIVPKKRTK